MEKFENFDLTPFNSYKVKARCAKAVFPKDEMELKHYISNRTEELIILGNGNNIILSKPFYKETFVILHGTLNQISVKGKIVEAEAGATTLMVSEAALANNLTGAEFFYDIPSSVGGAVVMNAGTKEGVTQQILCRVRYIDLCDSLIKEKSIQELNLGYRTSYFQTSSNSIILKAWFRLEHGNHAEIKDLMQISKSRRWEKQPRELPNCGSVFKRPTGYYVGPMIEELGLMGYSIGGAQISTKHAGFIVNAGEATGEDILLLIQEVKKRVREYYNVDLEVEQRII